MNRKIIFVLSGIILLVFFLALTRVLSFLAKKEQEIADFDGCLKVGHLALETYPRQCRLTDGRVFVEDIGNQLEKQDLIQVSSPRPNQLVASPVDVSGQARGYWFFEADFPVRVLDANGQELGWGIARALDDWMSEDFVSFRAEIEFEKPTTAKGFLVLEKDNPSGLPEHADELRFPVFFADF